MQGIMLWCFSEDDSSSVTVTEPCRREFWEACRWQKWTQVLWVSGQLLHLGAFSRHPQALPACCGDTQRPGEHSLWGGGDLRALCSACQGHMLSTGAPCLQEESLNPDWQSEKEQCRGSEVHTRDRALRVPRVQSALAFHPMVPCATAPGRLCVWGPVSTSNHRPGRRTAGPGEDSLGS